MTIMTNYYCFYFWMQILDSLIIIELQLYIVNATIE